MFTEEEERTIIFSFIDEIKIGYSSPYIRMRVMEFVRAMAIRRNVDSDSDSVINFSKWLEAKFCKNENYPDHEDIRTLEESIFNVLK